MTTTTFDGNNGDGVRDTMQSYWTSRPSNLQFHCSDVYLCVLYLPKDLSVWRFAYAMRKQFSISFNPSACDWAVDANNRYQTYYVQRLQSDRNQRSQYIGNSRIYLLFTFDLQTGFRNDINTQNAPALTTRCCDSQFYVLCEIRPISCETWMNWGCKFK